MFPDGPSRPSKLQIRVRRIILSSSLLVLPILPGLPILQVVPITDELVAREASGRGEALIYVYVYMHVYILYIHAYILLLGPVYPSWARRQLCLLQRWDETVTKG